MTAPLCLLLIAAIGMVAYKALSIWAVWHDADIYRGGR